MGRGRGAPTVAQHASRTRGTPAGEELQENNGNGRHGWNLLVENRWATGCVAGAVPRADLSETGSSQIERSSPEGAVGLGPTREDHVAIKLGVHTGPQDLSMEELRRIWQLAEAGGLYWASVWDHFYANPLKNRSDACFEGVASLTALAASTERLRVGCLVFCALFRNPALLAKAAVTIDHLSGGRVELGMGAGWFEEEFREFGYDFPPLGQRLDRLEEALRVVRSLLRDEVTDFRGKYYQLSGAVCGPKPINPKLRIWVGGRGLKRTPQLAARYADGFNVPYVGPDAFRERVAAVERACEGARRDPAEIECSVNLGFYLSTDPERGKPSDAELAHLGADGLLVGAPQQAVDRIGEYERAGAQGLNIAFRPPVDWEAYQMFLEEVAPKFP